MSELSFGPAASTTSPAAGAESAARRKSTAAGHETALAGTVCPTWLSRLSLNQLTTPRWSLDEALQQYAEAGYPAIGLNWKSFDDEALSRSIDQIRCSPLQVSSLGWCGGFTGAFGHSYAEAMYDAQRKLRVARQISAGTLVVIPGVQFNHIRSHAARLTVDALNELCDSAAGSSVRVAVQPMHKLFRKNWSYLHTLEETLALLDRVSSPQVGLCFGTYHLWQEPQLIELIPEFASRLSLVHLSDWRDPPRSENDRLLPGDGCIPLPQIIEALEGAGYCGPYEIEVWSRDLWKGDHADLIRTCLQRYRQLWPGRTSKAVGDSAQR